MTTRHLSLLLLIAGLASGSSEQSYTFDQAAESPLIGTWKVVSVETIRPNGDALTDFLGKRPTGTLVYLASGYMAVQVMRDPRPMVAAVDGYYAYYGTYDVDARSGTVTHHVEASLYPNEVGTHYQRHFEVTSDRLTLTTSPSRESGELRFNRLVWERIR